MSDSNGNGTADQLPGGIKCPECECSHWIVLYTRAASGDRLKRRRECRHCGKRVTTYEHLAS